MPTKYVNVNGTPIHYWHAGATTLPPHPPHLERGECIVFLHGAGWNGAMWQPHLEHLTELHSPLAFDFPGHGRSGCVDGLSSIAAYADCIGAFLDAVARRPCVLVGHDLGAIAALAHACRAPQRVRGLLLVAGATPCGFPQSLVDTWHDVMRGRTPQPFTNDGFSAQADVTVLRSVLSEQVKTDPRVRYHDMLLCNAAAAPAELAQLRVPTLLIAGRDDPYVTPEHIAGMQTAIPNSRLSVVEAAGHYVPWEQTAAFEAQLSAFLQTLPVPAT